MNLILYHIKIKYLVFIFNSYISAFQIVRMEEIVQDLVFVTAHNTGLESSAIDIYNIIILCNVSS